MAPTPTTDSTTTTDSGFTTLPSLPSECTSFDRFFQLSPAKLQSIVDEFRKEFEEGLGRYGCDMAMVPSFVTGVPDGSETGTFLALDLGGTNLRVCEVKLKGQHQFEMKQQKYKVSDDLKNGEARVLFDYIAESVDAFMTEHGSELPDDEAVHLGFTFSFPVEQTALAAGKLLTWTKGFAAKNAVGHDVVKLLQDALDRKHIHVKCSALVNDTVGTLLSRSYQAGPALVGAIFGTGTNGAYIDSVKTVPKLGEAAIAESLKGGKEAGEYMVVNTEWGAMDNKRKTLPISMFDNKVDRESINPRKQAFEKLVSGMYLGEITRNILLHFLDQSLLFAGHSTTVLNTHYGFDTSFVSAIEGTADSAEITNIIHKELGVPKSLIKEQDVSIVRWACKSVAARAASLAACAIAAVVLHTGNDKPKKGEEGKEDQGVDIGVDGSVAEFLPGFRENVAIALGHLLGQEGAKRVRIGLAKDGSGVGAALCALQAKKAELKGVHTKLKSVVPAANGL